MAGTYFGKYRGTVVDNVDPMQMGRVQAMVPAVFDTALSGWAMPCVPFAEPQAGMWCLPAVGAEVWVEFEQGDPDYPIWTGGFWSTSLAPAGVAVGSPTAQQVIVQTSGLNVLSIRDDAGPAGGLMLKSASGAMIQVNDVGITIANGAGASITLTGPTVTINEGALVVI